MKSFEKYITKEDLVENRVYIIKMINVLTAPELRSQKHLKEIMELLLDAAENQMMIYIYKRNIKKVIKSYLLGFCSALSDEDSEKCANYYCKKFC